MYYNRGVKRIRLNLEAIDWADESFRTSPPVSLDKLVASLKAIGLLHPPLVTGGGGRWVIVSGWKRLLACRALARSPVEVIDTEERDALKNVLLGFLENVASRPIGLIEKAEILSRLVAFGEDRETIRRDFLPLLDLPQNAEILQDHLRIAGFTPEIKRGIEDRSVAFPVARVLAAFSPAERQAVFPHLLPLGQNKQKEILEHLREICLRDDITAVDILGLERVREAVNLENVPPIQRSELLRQALFRMRFPAYSLRRDEFEAAVKALDLPPDLSLEPDPFFEKNEAMVSFRVRSPGSLRAILSRFEGLASDEEFRRVFSWMT